MVPEEVATHLTAVESRLAARDMSQVSAAGVGQGDTALKDKVAVGIDSLAIHCMCTAALDFELILLRVTG